MSVSENILDEDLSEGKKNCIRTSHIQQVETAILLALPLFIIFSPHGGFSMDSSISGNLIVRIIAQFLVFISIFGWRRESIKFDNNINAQKFHLPLFLSILRVWIPLYSIWSIFSILIFINFLYSYSLYLDTLDSKFLIMLFLQTILGFILSISYLYYWHITRKAMNLINK